MQVQIVLLLTQGEAAEIAHTLAMAAFDKQKSAAFWEGMGDDKLNQQSLKQAKLLSQTANIFAMAHWTEERRLAYFQEEVRENG